MATFQMLNFFRQHFWSSPILEMIINMVQAFPVNCVHLVFLRLKARVLAPKKGENAFVRSYQPVRLSAMK